MFTCEETPVTFRTSSPRLRAAIKTPFQSSTSTTIVAVLPLLAMQNCSVCAIPVSTDSVITIVSKYLIIYLIRLFCYYFYISVAHALA